MAASFSLTAEGLGKRYNREWIFRELDAQWSAGECVGIRGANGSGKSTLLRVLSGFLSPSRGALMHQSQGKTLPRPEVYRYLSLAAPYVSLVEELSLREFIRFHFSFKNMLPGYTVGAILERLELGPAADRQLAAFSSGMKQRVKLASAMLADCPLLILDEPTTNLDDAGKSWCYDLLKDSMGGRLVLLASNEAEDFVHCTTELEMRMLKPGFQG